MKKKKPVFLRAAWHYLIMANYEVPPAVLQPYVPASTELDFYKGKAYASMVGFRFLNTRVLGIPFPFHRNFSEVNLRFYVRRLDEEGQWRRGTVFISEIVPKPAVAFLANTLYREQYSYAPMRYDIHHDAQEVRAHYRWKKYGKWHRLYARADPQPQEMQKDSMEEFIAEHYWGYNRFDSRHTMEYAVEHPRWQYYPVREYEMQADVEKLYGAEFLPYLSHSPESVFLLHGSDVLIRHGNRIKSSQP
ncbi:MAG: YqjF family protein [Cyclobacteriaceae bacterium]